MRTDNMKGISTYRHEASSPNIMVVDQILFLSIILLICFGLLSLNSASQPISIRVEGTAYVFFLRQIMFFLLGLGGMWFFSRFDHKRLFALSTPLYFAALVLIALVFSYLGIRINGARRWIRLGPLSFAPAIIVHLTSILYLAQRLSRIPPEQRSFLNLAKLFAVVWIPMVLIAIQPNFSDAIILLLTAAALTYIAGFRPVYFAIILVPIILPIFYFVYSVPYRRARIDSFMSSPQTGWHLMHSLVAVGSGGVTGVGYGAGILKHGYLPDAYSAFVFANIAEEFGLIGTISVLLLFGLLIARCVLISLRTQGIAEKLFAFGITLWLALQILLNIGSVLGLLPIAGLQLPFFSYGGTRTIADLCALGMLLNISAYTGKYEDYVPKIGHFGLSVLRGFRKRTLGFVPKIGDVSAKVDSHPLYILLALIGLILTILASGIQLFRWFVLHQW